MRGNREEKQALDRQTAYLTFLPPMDEGFHTGYHTAPGIVSDHNPAPARMAGKPGPLPANAGHRRELFHPRRAQRRASSCAAFRA